MTTTAELPVDAIQRHLETMLGAGATFRDGQREAIEAVVARRRAGARRPADGLGQEPRLLDRDPRPPRRGPRADADHQPAAGADAQPDRMAASGSALRAVTINSGNRDEWDARRGRPRRRRDRRPAHLAGAARQRATSRRDVLPGDPGLDRPVRGRRGALHLRLGPRLPARLPAHRPDPATCSTARVPVLATTATANDRVVADIVEQLGEDVRVIRGPLARDIARARRDHARRPGRAAGLARRAPAAAARAAASSTA